MLLAAGCPPGAALSRFPRPGAGRVPAAPAGERFRPPFSFLKKRTGRGRSKRKTFCRAGVVFLHSTGVSAALRCKPGQSLPLAPRVPLRYALLGRGRKQRPQAPAPCVAAVRCERRCPYPLRYLVDVSSTSSFRRKRQNSLVTLRRLSPRKTLCWVSAGAPRRGMVVLRTKPLSSYRRSVKRQAG